MTEKAGAECKAMLSEGTEPVKIIDDNLIPALDKVGKSFEEKKTFLPQLLMSADAAKVAFDEIKKYYAENGTKGESKGTVVMATVKGDIHDIGKNIVKVLLENYDYTVIDLGKDVAPETIVDTVLEHNIKLVGLSALMTTTVVSMEETIKQLREKAPFCKVVVGGAVLTPEYAEKIGADAYSPQAMDTVKYAKEVFGK
jgi:5-methyltetrahydrofolate--homocysteine methyltransferase